MFPSKLVKNYKPKIQKIQVHVPLMIIIIINKHIIFRKVLVYKANTCTIYDKLKWNEFDIKA